MEDWQQDWVKAIEAKVEAAVSTAASNFDIFFQDASKEVGNIAMSWLEVTDEMATQLETQAAEWLDPFLELGADLGAELEAFLVELQWLDPISEFTDSSPQSVRTQHPICKGCRHFHGEVYNGTPFICAMHPYGIVDGADSCADKESFSWRLPPGGQSSEDDF